MWPGAILYRHAVSAVDTFFLTLLMVGLLVMQTRDGSLHLDAQEMIVLALYFSFLVLAGASTLIQGGSQSRLWHLKTKFALSLVMICLLLGFLQGITDLPRNALSVLGVLRADSGNDLSGFTGCSPACCGARRR